MLALLDRGAAHGYELKRAHDELFGDVAPPVNIGQIYVTLTRLERDGSVVHRVEKGTDGPDRKVYELTATGRKALRGWLDEPSDLPVGKSDIVQKLVAGLICDGTRPQPTATSSVPAADGGRGSYVAPAVSEHRMRCLRALRHLIELGAAAGGDGTGDSNNADGSGGDTAADAPLAGLGELLREASVLHLQAELRWLDLVEERLTRAGRA
jgi:DNA-binding PadR family transcriptional regulator